MFDSPCVDKRSCIGEETVFTFAEAGVSAIAFADIDEQKAAKVAETSKGLATNKDYRTLVLPVDVTDPTSVQHMVDETIRVFGRIDHNLNAAGVLEPLLSTCTNCERTNSC